MLITLRRGDGLRQMTPAFMPAVERLQRALDRAGHPLLPDGRFGEDTELAVRGFQKLSGLLVDGVAGPATWRLLERFQRPGERLGDHRRVLGFESFHGDLAWLQDREGHVGKPYWPGGIAGVTLDPGFDLRFARLERIREHYAVVLSPEQEGALARVIGRRGGDARDALYRSPLLQSIQIPRALAMQVMPHIAVDYWQAIAARFPGLEAPETPPAVHTVMLSLAYNRGPENPELDIVRSAITRRDWTGVAELVRRMQQDHELPGIRSRRRLEASLILDELDFAQPSSIA